MSDSSGNEAGNMAGRFAPREIGAGLFLIVLGLLALGGAWTLNFGKLSGIGPGLMPKVTAVIVVAFGVLLLVTGSIARGPKMDAWSGRGILFVLGAVLVFAATVRTCGLLVAGPLAVGISALGDKDTRPVEIVTFAVVLTSLCGIMFKDLLNLPIPFDPLGLVPGPVVSLYAGFKVWFASTFSFVLQVFKR